MIEDGNMRLNAALMDEPGKIGRITIAAIGSQTVLSAARDGHLEQLP